MTAQARPYADTTDADLSALIEEHSTRELADALVTPHLDLFDDALDEIQAFADAIDFDTGTDECANILRNACAELRLRAHSVAP